jgi:type IV pilus assembly protein PilB
MVHFDEDEQNRSLRELHTQEEEELAEILAKKYNVSYVNLSKTTISTDALRVVKETDAKTYLVAPFSLVGKKIGLAAVNPQDPSIKELSDTLKQDGFFPTFYMASHASLEKAWSRYADITFASESTKGALDIPSDQIEEYIKSSHGMADITAHINDAVNMKAAYRTSRILVIILAGALSLKSSDVHIEPEEDSVRVRYRLDGVLMEVARFDSKLYSLILSRIKLISGLKLNVKENSQDGRFSIHIEDNDIEIRTSTLPGAYGESIVMRLLNPHSLDVPLESMGIPEKLYARFMLEIEKPNGMILTTGPTGSGKTTTLYSFMKKVQSTEIKIITIEDPIEYHLAGITQTQIEVKKGYTFAQGLRSALRQDPDVIMVGEIRDNETADIAINSALTGHLVFSTLHTNNAAGTFTRLIDLGMNPRILTSAINVAIAQRLVRRLCKTCAQKVPVTDPIQKKKITRVVEGLRKRGLYDETLDQNSFYITKGCAECHNTGYKGRVGVFEAIFKSPAIEEIVRQSPSEREIEEAAQDQGIMTLAEDGITKVLSGVTSLEELERVIEIAE